MRTSPPCPPPPSAWRSLVLEPQTEGVAGTRGSVATAPRARGGALARGARGRRPGEAVARPPARAPGPGDRAQPRSPPSATRGRGCLELFALRRLALHQDPAEERKEGWPRQAREGRKRGQANRTRRRAPRSPSGDPSGVPLQPSGQRKSRQGVELHRHRLQQNQERGSCGGSGGGRRGAGGARGGSSGRSRPELPADPSHGSFGPHELGVGHWQMTS